MRNSWTRRRIALVIVALVIDGDSIQSVGGKETAYPPDATVIDMAGKFIIPGLIESHAHYEGWMGELFLNQASRTRCSGEIKWTYDQRAAMGSVLTTAGGLVFAGGGTAGQRDLARLYPELKAPNGSNVLMVFALGE